MRQTISMEHVTRGGALALALAVCATPSFGEQPAKETTPNAFEAPATATKLLVPAYFYPAGDGLKEWDRLFDAASRVPIIAIVNPASGPGKKVDPLYTKIVERSRQSPIGLIGYVSSSYAKRPLNEAKADVDAWVQFYPGIQGIFVDEQASGPEKLEYYQALYKHVREVHKLKAVVSNPGTICSEKYITQPATDVAGIFEGPRAFMAKDLPPWIEKNGGSKALVVAYKVPEARQMREAIALAAANKVRYLYVTDAEGANPWIRLPSYWNEEVAEVEKLNKK